MWTILLRTIFFRKSSPMRRMLPSVRILALRCISSFSSAATYISTHQELWATILQHAYQSYLLGDLDSVATCCA